ncbi:acyltransferase family protein [Streptomyces armeniacus]|nr:acyltransferase family protein [Streptomyces armeniacus]
MPGTSGKAKKPDKTDTAGRDPFFDNAKYLAIVLVACAHSWEPFRNDSRAATALYMFVYTFHMPAFIVISGYFSRGFDLSPRRLHRLVTGILVPYVLFEFAYAFFRRWADDDPTYPVNLVDPYFLNWFLVALFVWRLTTPIWRTLRWPVPIAVGIALLSAVTPDVDSNLDLQRVLQFLPFFVLGLVLNPEHFALLRRRAVRLAALPVGATALVFAYWAAPRLNYQWFYRRDSGQDLGVQAWAGGAMSVGLFACSMLLTACFLAWVPRRRMWFTALGAGTLYGYLLHGFLVKGSVWWGWYDTDWPHADWPHTPLGMVAVTLVAGVVITLLCTEPVRRVFRFAVEPRMDWLFRPDPVAQARRRVQGDVQGDGDRDSGQSRSSPVA